MVDWGRPSCAGRGTGAVHPAGADGEIDGRDGSGGATAPAIISRGISGGATGLAGQDERAGPDRLS